MVELNLINGLKYNDNLSYLKYAGNKNERTKNQFLKPLYDEYLHYKQQGKTDNEAENLVTQDIIDKIIFFL